MTTNNLNFLEELLRQSEGNSHYTELRLQKTRAQFLNLINGDLTSNQESESSGLSARSFINGGWGYSSSSLIHNLNSSEQREMANQLLERASNHGHFMSKAMQNPMDVKLPDSSFQFIQKEGLYKGYASTKDQIDFLKSLHSFIKEKYSDLKSIQLILSFNELEKSLVNTMGSQAFHLLPRTALYLKFSMEKEGEVVSLLEPLSGNGRAQIFIKDPKEYEETIDTLYKRVKDKSEGIHATAGVKDLILAPAVTGILAHEAIGHPAEADLVKAGSVASQFLNKKVGSELVTMVDLAHTYNGEELPVPVYIDDEGVEGKDVTLIDKGVFKGYMNNRELASFYSHDPSGSARAYDYNDEPLIRMRNTMILPGESKLEEMISSIEDGYYFLQSSNGQADLTSEFMFGVTMGYEIKNGKLGRAIKDTTISGVAFDMLDTVDMVSDEMHISCSGFCGKKQRMIVSHGGPSLKCRLHVGGRS
ncbi:MAG: peptidase [Halobacteriovoraceae bacterium]|nr:peptidase [Halobacteriovoraceae bacterium]